MTASQKTEAISFGAMWAVVAWHCYCGSDIERWFIPVFCYWSVPWFFLVSGFFFVKSFEKRSWKDFAIGKVRSLLVPYIVWCIFGFITFLVFSGKTMTYSPCAIFALGGGSQPVYNPPLWYMRALIVFLFIGAIARGIIGSIRFGNRLLREFVFCLIFLVGYASILVAGVGLGPKSSPVYFLLGSMAADYSGASEKLTNWIDRHCTTVCVIALLFMIILRMIWFLRGYSFSESGQGGVVINNLCTVTVVVALWTLLGECDISHKIRGGVFVYLMHRPLLLCLIERSNAVLTDNGVVRNIVFIMLVALCAPFILFVGNIVKRHMPRIYSVLVGGR